MKFGIWPAQYALGEKYRYAELYQDGRAGRSIEVCELYIREWVGLTNTMDDYQRRAESFLKLVGGQVASANAINYGALFGPVERSKAVSDRCQMITHALSADTGKMERSANSYNLQAVTMYALRWPNGDYMTPSGGRTCDEREARHFYTREEATAVCKTTQVIVEV